MLKFGVSSVLIFITSSSILLGTFAPTPKRVPKLFTEPKFNSAMLAEATNYFIARGEKSTIAELVEIAARDRKNGVDHSMRVSWVCRILWGNEKTPIRPPMLGGFYQIEFGYNKPKVWPICPLARSGDTYFVLSQEYILGGERERIPDYIDHCRQNGIFRHRRIPIPTRDRAMQDIESFRRSTRWVSEFTGGTDSSIWNYIRFQAELIGRNAG